MSRDEYNWHQDCGTLWLLYPETTGDYEEDIRQIKEELNERLGT